MTSCTKECAKIGAKYVLLDNQTGKVYQVDDQAKIAEFAGQHEDHGNAYPTRH